MGFLIVLLSRSAYSDYRITTDSAEVWTQTYWIEGDRVVLLEGGEPLELSRIVSVEEIPPPGIDPGLNRDAEKRYFRAVSWLLDWEEEFVSMNTRNMDMMREITELRETGEKHELRRRVKGFERDIDSLEELLSRLTDRWETLRIPDISRAPLHDVKRLEFLSYKQSLMDRRRFTRRYDPTFLEYALEHDRQAGTFRDLFRQRYLRALAR
ncbi:MAG: hypothetical protein ACP5G0_12875 [Desulfomonilia bacterium]